MPTQTWTQPWRLCRRTETDGKNIKLLIISDGISTICCYKPRFTFLLATPHRLSFPSPFPLLSGFRSRSCCRSRSRSGCCSPKDPIIKTIVRYRHLGQHVFCIRTRMYFASPRHASPAGGDRKSEIVSLVASVVNRFRGMHEDELWLMAGGCRLEM